MPITQSPSAPLVAVVGATGIQGGSVIEALAQSNKFYRIRAFTRDSTKPASQKLVSQGVEVVTISLVLDNVKGVFNAFSGANMVFLVTAFAEHFDAEREIAEAKMMIDAAKAAGVNRIVWSGLTSPSRLSAGKYTHVVHFDGKSTVTDYGRESGVPFVDVQAGWYASNFTVPGQGPVKRTDGSFAIRIPVSPMTSLPVLDAARDYGLYVRHTLEAPIFPNGSEVLTGEYMTFEGIALQLSQGVNGYREAGCALGMPAPLLPIMSDGYKSINEFGYYGGKPSPSIAGLARISFTEFAKAADWSKVLVT
ncbi:NAD(P)-binding protein [Mycena galopus ATCC 62051]|nr:NAD(P)-binding protein [Mycena galopus ATCC 62051]